MAEPTDLRADAARNRAQIVEAARDLFRTRGVDVPLSTIARRAGVGVATLFRRFPSREALVTEVFAEQIAHCEALLDDAVTDPDPWTGFRRLLEFIRAEQIEDRGFTEAFIASFSGDAGYRRRREDAESALEALVRRAKDSGRLRPDFAISDLVMLVLANGGLRDAPPEHAHDLSRRLMAYLLQAFDTEASPGGVPLPPASPLGLHHARRGAGDRPERRGSAAGR
ncbi:transcriptional regulator, TetR family [Lentzea xinjiangensis]|uniref:Transcriptional regulator, TetR family n=1 Tax=Lentzea xinjiangensis TaxID=402600 RepID=A0A1H9RH81_9PSEU|nr:TetR/AcrR family transcriptional regulator [Lentzea xinjiangensis]SER71988.1 transcriptional regulator, TetR family [Lentzea xinjiangensis]